MKHLNMKRLKKKHLIAVGAGAVILLVLLVLLLFSCEAESGRTELLYPSVVMADEHSGTADALISKPDGYPAEVGNALAMMMSLHKDDVSYLYHVAFRDGKSEASTKDSIVNRLENAGTLHSKEWVEIATDVSREQGWFYFLFTADEIRALAGAGIECRFVGSGKSLPDDGAGSLSWEQAVEHICQWAGDSFRAETGDR